MTANLVGKNKIKLALLWPNYNCDRPSFNELARHIDPDRFEMIVIILRKRQGDPEGIDKFGYRVFYLSEVQRINAFGFSILRNLVKVLKAEKVEILHAHRHKSVFYSALASFFTDVKVILGHVHGLNRCKTLPRKLVYFLFGRKISSFLACSKGVKEDILANFPTSRESRVTVLPNSIDYKRFAEATVNTIELRKSLSIDENAFVFLAIGRFVPTKDFITLIKAFSKVRYLDKCHLLFAGDGRQRSEMEALVKSLGIEDRVHMPGMRKDVPEVMKACDSFVMSSIAEGMPFTLLEAMASGLPCVATGVGGIPEVIENEDLGKIISPGDIEALAGAMSEMVEMPYQKRLEMIEKSRQRVRNHYCHEKLVVDLMDLYESQLKASER